MQEPLAKRLRPTCLKEMIGQTHLVGKDCIFERCISEQKLFSMIFYGPPGTGKTTMAYVLANEFNMPTRFFNAVSGSKKDLQIIFEESKLYPELMVIIDEVHRLNKDKQDLLLPYLEDGSFIMIGATTANPLHAINPAIRSRTHLIPFHQLNKGDVLIAIDHAINSEKGLNKTVTIDEDAKNIIANHANGDLRYALNILEICGVASSHISSEVVKTYNAFPNTSMDKDGDGYYDVLSAFQKSIRGSDIDAALYYLAIMIEADDLDSIERRMLVTAYEDIGLGNPSVVARCVQALEVARKVGFPEARIPIAVALIDLVLAPKSKSGEMAIDSALASVRSHAYPVVDYLKLTPTALKEVDKYDYDRSDIWDYLQYLPNAISNKQFYFPGSNGAYESILASNYDKLKKHKRTNEISKLKQKKDR